MTSLTLESTLPPAKGRAGWSGALHSEWTKIRSLRSTVWTLIATAGVTIGLSVLFAWGATSHFKSRGFVPPDFDAVQASMFGLIFGQLVITVLGAMTITGEYGTGMIRTSLTAQPRRYVTLLSKLAVFTAVTLVTGLVCTFVSFFVGQRFFGQINAAASISDPNALRAVIGGALFLTVAGLLSFGFGAILRHTAGAITASVGVLFISFILFQFLPSNWQIEVQRWIPFFDGTGIWQAGPTDAHQWGPWTGFGVFFGYAAVALIGGILSFRTRDA
jgi:ABC-2 type transport system permease protein